MIDFLKRFDISENLSDFAAHFRIHKTINQNCDVCSMGNERAADRVKMVDV